MACSRKIAVLCIAAALGVVASARAELPDKFVEYIQGTGTQYFELGPVLSDQSRVSIDFCVDKKVANFNIFGVKATYAYVTHDWLYVKGKRIVKTCAIGTRYTVDIDVPAQTIAMNGEQMSLVNYNGNEATKADQPTRIFWAGDSSENKALMKLYSCAIFDGDTPLFQLFPCVKNGKPGLFNAVSGTIIYDAGNSGIDFAVGSEVPMPPECATLKIAGYPSEYGSPEPAYGHCADLPGSGSFTATAPVRWDCEDGQMWAECVGWRLLEKDGTEISGSGATATFEDVAVLQRATLTWIWKEHAPFGVTSVAVGGSRALGQTDMEVAFTGIGLEASAATVTVHYGSSPTCLFETAEVTVDRPGTVRVPLDRLQAGVTYYVRVSVLSATGETYESELISFVQPTVFEPGLNPRARAMPAGYVQMEKLTSTGAEWILTDFVPTSTTATEFEFGEVAYVNQTAFFGQRWNGSQYLFNMQSDNFYFHGGGALSPTKKVEGGTDYSMTITPTTGGNGTLTLVNGKTGETIAPTVSLASANEKLSVFASNSGGNKAKYTLYSLKFWKVGELAADYVPAWEESSQRAGLYDLHGGTFYPSKGTAFARQELVRLLSLVETDEGFAIETSASAEAQTVSLYASATSCGTVGWGAAVQTATVPAGETRAVFSRPSGWGETVWYVRAGMTVGGDERWSNTLQADNPAVPSVEIAGVDGSGGDTMVVRGNLASFAGSDCTLTVLVGTTPDELTAVWTGLSGAVMTQAGEFELTLHEADLAAARYLQGGATYAVVVEAAANGYAVRSAPMSATMKSAPTFGTTSSAVSRREVTFTGSLTDCGAGDKAVVTLWAGEGTDPTAFEQVAGPLEVSDGDSFSLSAEFSQFEHDYGWQFRATSTAVGATASWTASSAVMTAHTIDDSTYTWKGGASGDWCEAANWTASTGDDRLPWPQSTTAKASFTAGQTARIRLTEPLTVGTVNANVADLKLTFFSDETEPSAAKLTVATFNVNSSGGSLALSNAAVKVTASDMTIGSARRFVVDTGSDFHTDKNLYSTETGTFEVRDGATASVNIIGIGGGNSDKGGAIISNATLTVRSWTYLGYSKKGGSIRFEGAAPRLVHTNNGGGLYSNLASAGAHLDFLVPVGGYAEAPVTAPTAGTIPMGNSKATTAGLSSFAVNVLSDSPAARVDETVDVALVNWPKGFNRTLALEGTLPDEGAGTGFVWAGDPTVTSLAVHLVGSAHGDRLDVVSAQGEYCPSDISPSYGQTTGLTVGQTVICSAPAMRQDVSDDIRVTCAGWKRYLVDPATHELTFETSGSGATCAFEHDGRWRRLEWQWTEEFRVTATAGANGTVSPTSQWTTNGCVAFVTATAAAGSAFKCWTDDAATANLIWLPTMPVLVDRPRAFTANFGRAVYVSAIAGDDTTGDCATGDPFASIQAAVTAAEAGDVILVAADTYAPSATLKIEKGVTVRGADGTKREDVRISGSGKRQVVLINHADAVLCGVTVENGNGSLGCGVKVDANGGSLVNCIVRNGTGGGGGCGLVALAADNAYCFNCVITNYNTGNFGGGTRPGGCLYLSKGKAANCFIADGRGVDIYTYVSGPGIRIDGGTVANCTVVRCHSACDGGIAGLGGKVYNCLVWDTWCDSMADNNYDVFYPCSDGARGNYPSWVKDKESIPENCVARFAINANCLAATDIPAAGDHWTPLPGSAVIDAGKNLDWLPSVDLDGNPRKVGGAVDVGCCEYQGGAAAVAFSCSTHEGLLPLEVTFTATVEGEAAATYDWDFGDGTVKTGGAETETHVYETSGDFLPKVTNGSLTWTACKPLAVRSPSVAVATTAELDAALDAAIDGQEIVLAKGEYDTKATRNITKSLVLRGATGNPEDVILKTSVASVPALRVSSKSARIESLVLDGGSKKSGIRGIGLIHYGGGTISNCVARNNTKSGNGNGTVGVYGANSLCTHCIVTNNTSESDGQAGSNSAGVQLVDGGKASNCLVAGNTMSGSDTRSGRINAAGASLSGGSCALENCTVVNNTGDTVGGVYANAGKVVNCVIGKNTSTSYGSERANIMSGTESRFTFCRITDDVVSGYFSNYAVGDFTVAAGSPLIDAGDTATLTSVPAADLAGNPRLMGKTEPLLVDIGAYEFNPNVFGVTLNVSDPQAFVPTSVTFTADVSGTNGTDEIAFVWTVGAAAPVTNSTASYAVDFTVAGGYDVRVVVLNLSTGASVTDAKDSAVRAMPKTMFVVDGNESAAFPYDTPDTAAAKLKDALAVAIPGSVIELAPGRHTVAGMVRLEQKLTIRGGGATPGDVVLQNSGGSYSDSVFRFSHPQARVENLTFKLANVNGCPGLRFFGDGGVISNCVVTGASHEACVHNASDATVVSHTIFTNVTVTTSSGSGFRPKGFVCDQGGKGRYSNCLFYGNDFRPGEPYPFFWLRGSLENCTVVTNRFKQSAFDWNAGVGTGSSNGGNMRYLLLPYAGATVVANAFAANMTNGVPAFTYGKAADGTVVGNVSDGMQVGEDGLVASAEELFKHPERGDWRLRGGSAAVDIVPKSVAREQDLPALDLLGRPRLFGRSLDAGCYECQSGGFGILVR